MNFIPSRNAPCPCGSEKKYKKCCMGKLIQSKEQYFGLLMKENILKYKLSKLIKSQFDPEEIDEYAYTYSEKDFDELSDEDIIPFLDWLFLEARQNNGEKFLKKIIDDFAEFFEPMELKILQEWAEKTQAGIFEAITTDPENWEFILKEIFTNKTYKITDRRGSAQIVKGDIIFARIQEIFSRHYLSGVTTFYPRQILDELKQFIKYDYELKKKENAELSYEEFMNNNSLILNNFHPEEPKYITYDGEEVKICETTYAIDMAKTHLFLDWFDEHERFEIMEVESTKNKIKSANIIYPYRNITLENKKQRKDKTIVFTNDVITGDETRIPVEASIDIKKDKLVIFTQSEKSLQKLKKILETGLGRYLTFKKEKIDSMDTIKSIKEKEKPDKQEGALNDELGQKMLENYYKEWCYKKIPALGNKTPKEAIKTKEGRDAVNELIRDIENHYLHQQREEGKYIPAEKIIRNELNFYEE